MQEQPLAAWLEAAHAARGRAYAPYSNYAVGAALVGATSRVYQGANVENASYGLTICAERAALFAAVAAGERTFQALVVVTNDGGSPCGACRQVLAEFCDDLPIWLVAADGALAPRLCTLAALLPDRFAIKKS